MTHTASLSITSLLIIAITTIPSTIQAGALTRGNILAEGVAGCSLGVAATVQGIIELFNFSTKILNPHTVTNKTTLMMYPETTGREY